LAFYGAVAAQPSQQQDVNAVSAGPVAPYSAAAHDRLINDWRARRIAAAEVLARLRAWQNAATPPLEAQAGARLASDRISIAQQAGLPGEAVAAARGDVPVAALAPYALPPLAAAARRMGDTELQGRAVRRWLALEPLAWDARVQDALWRIDSGTLDAAERAIDLLAADAGNTATTPQRVAVLELRGVLAEARQDYAGALRHYEDLLKLEPDYLPAQRSRIFLASRLGTPNSALADALIRPGLLSPLELASLRQEALGERLRWALAQRDRTPPEPNRFDALDAVLRDGDALAAEFSAAAIAGTGTGTATDTTAWRAVQMRLDADRIVALFQRGRDAQTVQLYDQLRVHGPVPWYATAAAAGAQARLRRPDLAVPLYQAALRDGGDAVRMPSDVHVGLVYAYLDTAQFDRADALVADMIARTPPLLDLSPEAGRPNNEYGDLLGLRALVALYTDRPAQAEREFAQLTALAPLNAAYRTGQARTLRLREHPGAAVSAFEQVLAEHPDAIDARAGLAEALFDSGRLREATARVDALAQTHPDHGAVRSAMRTRDTVMAPRLDVDAGWGRDGGTLANRDWQVDTRLSSGWLDGRWRVFFHQIWGGAALGGAGINAPRAGLGLQWRSGRWDLSGEAHHTRDGPRRDGLALSAAWRASDQWRLSAGLDSNAWDIPWRARQVNVAGRDAYAGVAYIVNESRRFDARLARLDLTDGNDRATASLSWRERWISGPRLQFATTLAADAGRYGLQGVPYFSPERESTLSVTGRGQWLTWKRDDLVMLQVLEAGLGRYRQAGFGGGAANTVRYAHEWAWGAGWLLRYGLGTGTHPYDGVSERRREVFLQFSMPLR